MSVPRQLRTQTGRSIVLENELGKGGEGVVYEVHGNDHVAAKIYHRDKAADRSEKIEAIVGAEWHKLSGSIAFPIDALFAPTGQFVGFTMARVARNKPIHDLYSPTSRRTAFPNANFRFLLRTALNIARAVAGVHGTGCVIGDINHSGILISGNALATLIDCDSFQVQVGGKAFLCKVGVPDFTPPELQGKRLDQLLRTPNHDAFGLAVVLFNLLFMGRHPFAGRFLGRGDMPLELAISQYRFAYSARRSETQTEPPPHVALLSDLPQSVANAFEMAFGQIGVTRGRPKAVDWANMLQQAEGEVIQCASSPAHQYFRSVSACPWCKMEAAYPGFLAFAAPLISISSTATPTNLGQLIAAIRGVRDPGVASDLEALMPPFKGSPSLPIAKAKTETVRNYTAAIGTAVVAAVCFQIQYAVFGLIALVGSVLLALRRSNAEQEVQKRIDQAITGWGNIQVKWRQAASNSDFSHARQEADRLITELQNLGGEEARRMADLRARQRDTQLTQFLQQYYIGKATTRGIGRNRKIVLRSYGIETAADVDPHRIQQISGFGPVIAGKLVSWRRSIERRFAFNPNQPIPPIEIANVRNAIARKRSEFERKLKQSFEQLQRALHDILASRNSLQAAAIQVWKAKKQAELDKLAVANSFSLVPRLAGIFGVIVAIYALSQSFHTTTKASAPIGAKTEKPTITQPAIREPLQQSGTVPASVPATQRKTESLGGGTAREVGRVGPPSDTKWPTVTQPSSTPLKPATDTREQVSPPLDMKVATPADSPHQPTSTGGILTQKRDEGGGPTRTTLSAPTNLKSAAQQPVRPEARVTAIRPELLSREELIHIQARLRQVGFIGTVDGLWNQRTQEAIRQFKITNRLSNPDLWDPETDEKLKSPAAIRAHESFIGAWSEHPCRGTDVTRPPLRITSRRASSSDGGVCEFSNFDFQNTDWRVRALCTVGKNSWTANITFAVKGNQLTWSSERGVSTYHRCI